MYKQIVMAVTLGLTLNAEAQFFRFWRGNIKPDISYAQFQTGLNEIFVGKTAALKNTDAKLQSYHPFLFSQEMTASGLPAEIALVEYESEQTYQTFRATDAGKQYSDLHWDFFDKANSKSAVPQLFQDQPLEFENAYAVFNSNDTSFNSGVVYVSVIQRDLQFTDEQWKSHVKTHINYLSSQKAISIMTLVTAHYVIEYTKWNNRTDKHIADLNTMVTVLDPSQGFTDIINDPLVELHEQTMNKATEKGTVLNPDSGLGFN